MAETDAIFDAITEISAIVYAVVATGAPLLLLRRSTPAALLGAGGGAALLALQLFDYVIEKTIESSSQVDWAALQITQHVVTMGAHTLYFALTIACLLVLTRRRAS